MESFYEKKCRNLQLAVNSLEVLSTVLAELLEEERGIAIPDVEFVGDMVLAENQMTVWRDHLKDQLWAVYPLLPSDAE